MSMPVTSATRATTNARDVGPLLGPPRVVALGGGTGLPNVLRGLRPLLYPSAPRRDETPPSDRLVAIVTTTDDGGSSGRLRREFGVVPPGDIRNCLAALAEDQALLTELFQYRFEAGDGLNGHALGNLLLTALAQVTGDVTHAIEIARRVVGARGRVLPATPEQVVLAAELEDGRTVWGETAAVKSGSRIRRVSLEPRAPRCAEGVIRAIRQADVIVAGPGSLYTSILPPLLMPPIAEAIAQSRAARVFVLNLMTEPGETEGYDGPRHLEIVREHLGIQPFDHVVFNTAPIPEHLAADYASRGSLPVTVTPAHLAAIRDMGAQPLGAPLAAEDANGRIRHHPARLAATITACAHFGGRQTRCE